MPLTKKDFDILKEFNFERPPVCVKYTYKKPSHLDRLNENTTLCTMLKKAQEGNAFYADKHNMTCGGAILGMGDHSPVSLSGEFAAALKVFEEPRSASRLYPQIPEIKKGLINYVSFSQLDQFSFDPDVLIIFSENIRQTQILLRAASYRTANIWTSKITHVLGCAWIYVYPVISGKINYTITGLHLGMRAINAPIPQGLFLISVPWNLLPTVLENLQDEGMYKEWQSSGREEHYKKFNEHCAELRQKMPNY